MRRFLVGVGGAVFGSLILVAAVAAADPVPSASPSAGPSAAAANGAVSAVLGLSQAEIHDLRQDGLSLAQIAQKQNVAAEDVTAALVARWSERIEARVANGALTQTEATQLEAQLQARAEAMVSSTAVGGMQGAAVGAGPQGGAGNGAGNGDRTRARDGSGTGAGTGDGTCDGTGPHGPSRP